MHIQQQQQQLALRDRLPLSREDPVLWPRRARDQGKACRIRPGRPGTRTWLPAVGPAGGTLGEREKAWGLHWEFTALCSPRLPR